MTAGERSRGVYAALALGAAISVLTLLTPVVFKTWGDNGYIALTIPAGMSFALASNQHRRARFIHLCAYRRHVIVALRLAVCCSLRTSAVHRYLSIRLGRPGAGRRHQSLSLRSRRARARLPAGCRHLSQYQPLGLLPLRSIRRSRRFLFLASRVSAKTSRRCGWPSSPARPSTVRYDLDCCCGSRVTADRRGLVAYLWHPLPMWEIANSGHIDALMVALMMTGIWLAS